MNKIGTRRHIKKENKMQLIVIGAGIVALIIFFFVLFPKDKPSEEIIQSELAPDSVQEGEKDTDLKKISERLSLLEERAREIEKLKERIGDLEKSVVSISRSESLLQNRIGSPAPSPPDTVATSQEIKASEKKKASEKVSEKISAKAKYHVIRQGETLYQISRSYGVPVETVQKLNNIPPKTILQPGQKILISNGE